MPGFNVNGVGFGAPSDVQPYYKYTWEIDNFYGENAPSTSPLIFVKDVSLPVWEIERERHIGASLEYKFAKSISFQDAKIVWYDTVGLAEKVRRWRTSVWTPEGGLKPPAEYKKQSVIRSMNFAWEKTVAWRYKNSWPCRVDVGTLTYTDSEVKLVEVTLSYDWAEEIIVQS